MVWWFAEYYILIIDDFLLQHKSTPSQLTQAGFEKWHKHQKAWLSCKCVNATVYYYDIISAKY